MNYRAIYLDGDQVFAQWAMRSVSVTAEEPDGLAGKQAPS